MSMIFNTKCLVSQLKLRSKRMTYRLQTGKQSWSVLKSRIKSVILYSLAISSIGPPLLVFKDRLSLSLCPPFSISSISRTPSRASSATSGSAYGFRPKSVIVGFSTPEARNVNLRNSGLLAYSSMHYKGIVPDSPIPNPSLGKVAVQSCSANPLSGSREHEVHQLSSLVTKTAYLWPRLAQHSLHTAPSWRLSRM